MTALANYCDASAVSWPREPTERGGCVVHSQPPKFGGPAVHAEIGQLLGRAFAVQLDHRHVDALNNDSRGGTRDRPLRRRHGELARAQVADEFVQGAGCLNLPNSTTTAFFTVSGRLLSFRVMPHAPE